MGQRFTAEPRKRYCSEIENGTRRGSADVLAAIARAYGCSRELAGLSGFLAAKPLL